MTMSEAFLRVRKAMGDAMGMLVGQGVKTS
jgi:hypothetical protein